MPQISNKDELLATIRENYSAHFKVVGLLTAAHAACLGYAIKVLNDYSASNPAHSGVGIFIAIFGIGFVAAIVNYGALFFAKMVASNAIRDNRVPEEESSAEFLGRAAWYSLIISALALILGVAIFVVFYATY